jgi:transposase InsO family protein
MQGAILVSTGHQHRSQFIAEGVLFLVPLARLRDLANRRRRFGYRRLFILLREQGEPSGINRIYRICREEGLTVRKRRARRRAIGTRTPILVEAKVNARWSLDFVHDQLAHGRRFCILNIVDARLCSLLSECVRPTKTG